METKFRILTPYDLGKNLANYYNREVEALPEDDWWAIFVDGDACFVCSDFGHQIQSIIENNPDYGLFTCMSNRIGTDYMKIDGLFEEKDFTKIWKKGREIQKDNYNTMVDITNKSPLSGVLIAIRKDVWKKSGGFSDKYGKVLGVDNSIHYAVRDNTNYKIGLAIGLTVFHYYRFNEGIQDKSHLV